MLAEGLNASGRVYLLKESSGNNDERCSRAIFIEFRHVHDHSGNHLNGLSQTHIVAAEFSTSDKRMIVKIYANMPPLSLLSSFFNILKGNVRD